MRTIAGNAVRARTVKAFQSKYVTANHVISLGSSSNNFDLGAGDRSEAGLDFEAGRATESRRTEREA